MPALSTLPISIVTTLLFGLNCVLGSPVFEGVSGTAIIKQVNNEGTAAAAEKYPNVFHWDAVGGLTNIGHLDIPGYGSQHATDADGMSSCGSVIVGSSTTFGTFSQKSLAYRWTRQDGMVALGDTTVRESRANGGVSADGRTVAGWIIIDDGQHAVLWRDGQEILRLGVGTTFGAISRNGLWAAGYDAIGDVPFRWSTLTGVSLLGPEAAGTFPRAISDDGNTVTGQGTTGESGSILPFRWTAADGYHFITPLITGDQGNAFGMSADGRTIVGPASDGTFIWTQESGYRLVENVLRQHGANLSGWGVNSAWCVSPDGLTIGGIGVKFPPFGGGYSEHQGFIARLGPWISIKAQDSLIRVDYRGILQSSPDLRDWDDVDPQPTSPLLISPAVDGAFYRSRMITPTSTLPP